MQLSTIVEGISEDLRRAGAVGGEETGRIAELLVASIEPAVRLHLLDALHAAAAELSESAPGISVEVRLEGRDPVLRLGAPAPSSPAPEGAEPLAGYADDDLARLTLRLPEGLKGQIERIAATYGASINSWIVASLARALEAPSPPRGGRAPRRLTGFVQG